MREVAEPQVQLDLVQVDRQEPAVVEQPVREQEQPESDLALRVQPVQADQ
jgi:hypothetical protein